MGRRPRPAPSPPSGFGDCEFEKAAQRERKRAELTRKRQRFGLMGIELECRGLADDDLLAVLLLDSLVHREHANVSQNCLADVFLDAGCLFRGLVAARQQHIDVIVRQDEAAGAAVGRHFERHCAHALRQNGGQESAALGHHHLVVANRLSGAHRRYARWHRRIP